MNKAELDARIGLLMRDGRTVHYAFLNGYDRPAFEGSLEAVEQALRMRASERQPSPRKAKVRTFIVTVTPKFVVYADSHVYGESQVEIDATSAADAIKQARQRRRDEDGRLGVPATFRARLARTH